MKTQAVQSETRTLSLCIAIFSIANSTDTIKKKIYQKIT